MAAIPKGFGERGSLSVRRQAAPRSLALALVLDFMSRHQTLVLRFARRRGRTALREERVAQHAPRTGDALLDISDYLPVRV